MAREFLKRCDLLGRVFMDVQFPLLANPPCPETQEANRSPCPWQDFGKAHLCPWGQDPPEQAVWTFCGGQIAEKSGDTRPPGQAIRSHLV
jgi:hypothetical protein